MKKASGDFFYTMIGYLIIAVGVLLVGVLMATIVLWSLRHHYRPDVPEKWFGFWFFTPFLFGWMVKRYRRRWRIRALWTAMAALLALHAIGFYLILIHVQYWRLVWFPLLYPPEVFIMTMMLDWTHNRFGKHH
jgi:hypothetical protein